MFYDGSISDVNVNARALFRQFRACFLTHQHRASRCSTQQANFDAFQSLPSVCPLGVTWSRAEKNAFQPITDQIIECVTCELDAALLMRDPEWLNDMTILVTNNFDKAVLTSYTALLYATKNNQQLFRWRRELKKEIPPELESLIYDEDANSELFAYFVAGAPAQILDNGNGNVGWGVANGTPCKLHSLAWHDETRHESALQAIDAARVTGDSTAIDLPFPPDFINVQLLDSSGNLKIAETWPDHNNLEAKRIQSGRAWFKRSIIIPIGVKRNRGQKSTVQLGARVLANPIEVEYLQHAVDLAQVITVWKAQGTTLNRVVLNLEPIRGSAPSWGFEHVYVGLSRVTAAKYLRCMPLSGSFRAQSIRNLRPNIFTTRWRFDNCPDQ